MTRSLTKLRRQFASGILNVIDEASMDRRPVEGDYYYQIRQGVPHPIAGRAAVRRTAPYGIPCISGVRWDVFPSFGSVRSKISDNAVRMEQELQAEFPTVLCMRGR